MIAVLKRAIRPLLAVCSFINSCTLTYSEQPASIPAPRNTPPKTQPAPVRHEGKALPTNAPVPARVLNGHPNGMRHEVSKQVKRATATLLGTCIHTGEQIFLPEKVWRQGFLTCFGVTGTGKTTFLLSLIKQVMEAGHGLVLLEPHGDLTRQVIADIPKHREKDVVLLDLMDAGEFPFGLSLFECANRDSINEVAITSSLVQHVLEKTWDVGPHTPVLAQVVRHITFTMVEKGLTLAEIPLLLWDDAIRAELITTLKNTHNRTFWQQYNAKSPRERSEYINSTVNKLDSYLSQPLLANILCQERSSINLRHIMDNGQILLVLLSPQFEHASAMLGKILLSKLLLSTFGRADVPPESRRPFYVFADEWHRFASSDFATFIAEARKFSVIIGALATQSLELLDDASRAASLQACSLVSFRVSGNDSKELARSYDATPTMEQVGLEPQRAIVSDVVSHLINRGHVDARVAKFGGRFLAALDRFCGKKMHEGDGVAYDCWYGRLILEDSQAHRGRQLLNNVLYRCQQEQNGDITIPSLAIYVLAAAQVSSIEYAFSPYLVTYTDDICAPHYLKEFRDSMAQFGKPSFLTEGASHFVKRQRKKHQWIAEAVVEMLTELRYCMGVLAKTPIIVDTGQYVPQYRQRTYADQENLIANELSTLPNYTAKVRLLGS